MLEALQGDLAGHIGIAWPEIAMPPGPRQFFTEIQAYRNNFVEESARAIGDPSSTDRLAPPFAILQFGTTRRDYAYGIQGAIRVPVTIFYVARFAEGIYILHAFEKRTRKTPKRNIEQAKNRYRELLKTRRKEKHGET